MTNSNIFPTSWALSGSEVKWNFVSVSEAYSARVDDLVHVNSESGFIIEAPEIVSPGEIFGILLTEDLTSSSVFVSSLFKINASDSDYIVFSKGLFEFIFVSETSGWSVTERSTFDNTGLPEIITPNKFLKGNALGNALIYDHPFIWKTVTQTATAQPGDLLLARIAGTSSYDLFLPGTSSGVVQGEGIEVLADSGTNTGLVRVQPNGWKLNNGTNAVALGGGTYADSATFVFEGSTAANWFGSVTTTASGGGGGGSAPAIPNTLAQTVTLGYAPQSIAYNASASKLYISSGNQIRVYNASTFVLETTINTGITNPYRSTVKFNSSTNRLYATVAVNSGYSVAVINTTNNSVLTTYFVSFGSTSSLSPVFDIDTHNNRNIYFSAGTTNGRVYDNLSNTEIGTFNPATSPSSVFGTNGIVHVNGSTVKYFAMGRIGISESYAFNVSEFSGSTFAFTRSKSLAEFNGGTAQYPASMMATASNLYITDRAGNWVHKYQTSDLSYVSKFATGTSPSWVGRNTSSGKIFVANSGSANVNVFDSSEILQATISTGRTGVVLPDAAVDNSGNRLFLLIENWSLLQVFNT